jgi:archaemetzincin
MRKPWSGSTSLRIERVSIPRVPPSSSLHSISFPTPDYAFHKKKQYLSTAILTAILEHRGYTPYEKILGIVDYDLYVPELNFVFGEASRTAAVISLTRLRQSFYKFSEDQELFRRRVLTEAVHELGHTFGLGHCGNPRCVMFFSNSLMDTDRKGSEFCQKCKSHFPLSH